MKTNKPRYPHSFILFSLLGLFLLFSLVLLVHKHLVIVPTPQVYGAGLGKNLYGIAAGSAVAALSPTKFAQELDQVHDLGAGWVRIDIDWASIQARGRTNYDWALYDDAFTAAKARGINVLGIIDYTPSWELDSGCLDSYHCPPKSSEDYATFASVVAERYAPLGGHTWEIWNEPNLGYDHSLRFTLAGYTSLLKAAYTAIKQVDPTAVVLTGGTSPTSTDAFNFSPIDFLTGIYANGGKGYFDAVAHHPYCYGLATALFNCPLTYAPWNAWSQMQDTNPSLRSIMIANGDQDKKIWATEFGAPTGGGINDFALPVTQAQQAQMVSDVYTLFNSYSWTGPLFWHTYEDPCTTPTRTECYFGLIDSDGNQKLAFSVYKNLATTAVAVTNPTISQGLTHVLSLSENGNSAKQAATFSFMLNTPGDLTVNNLNVAIRDENNEVVDLGLTFTTTLNGMQSLGGSRALPAGTYTYWIAYFNNGTWTDLAPKKSFTLTP